MPPRFRSAGWLSISPHGSCEGIRASAVLLLAAQLKKSSEAAVFIAGRILSEVPPSKVQQLFLEMEVRGLCR